MRPMRVAVFGPGADFLSGISYYTAQLAAALSKRHEVTVVLFRKMLPKLFFPGRRRVGTPLASLDYGNARVVSVDYHNPATWRSALRVLRARGCEAWILPWWTASVFHVYLAMIFARGLRLRAKIVLEFHELLDPLEARNPGLRLYTRIASALLRARAGGAIVHSEADREAVRRRFGIEPSVVPHGLYDYPRARREEARQSLGIQEPRVLLYFGIVRRYKGLPVLLDAFDRLPESLARGCRLLIVGEPWDDGAALRARIAASPRRESVTWVDRYVPDAEIPRFFGAADAVVLPYLRASQSGVAHIAMAQGKPVILSRVGGLEALERYEGATLVPPGDAGALAKAMESVLQGPPKEYPAPNELKFEAVAEMYEKVLKKI